MSAVDVVEAGMVSEENSERARVRLHETPASTTTCIIVDCDKLRVARGWCKMHYNRWFRHGDPLTFVCRYCDKTKPYDDLSSSGALPGPVCNACLRSYRIKQGLARSQAEKWGDGPIHRLSFDSAPIKRLIPLMGTDESTICKRVGSNGTLWASDSWPFYLVDRVCIALRLHPAGVYGYEWTDEEVA